MGALLGLFLFSFSLSAADTCLVPDLLKNKDIQEFSRDIGAVAYKNGELNGCSWEKQMKYYGGLKRVADRLDVLIREVEAYDVSKLRAGDRRKVGKVKKTLDCVRDQYLDDMSFRCREVFEGNCAPGTRAYVDGEEKTFLGLKMKEVFPNKEINICGEKFEGLDAAYMDALIMHELAHFCGSENENEKYFLTPFDYRSPYAQIDENWHKNGDQFGYWYLFPFCVPGLDCDEHFFKED